MPSTGRGSGRGTLNNNITLWVEQGQSVRPPQRFTDESETDQQAAAAAA